MCFSWSISLSICAAAAAASETNLLSWFQEPWYHVLLSFFEPLQTFYCLRQSCTSVMPPPIVTVQLVQTEAFACQYLQTTPPAFCTESYTILWPTNESSKRFSTNMSLLMLNPLSTAALPWDRMRVNLMTCHNAVNSVFSPSTSK